MKAKKRKKHKINDAEVLVWFEQTFDKYNNNEMSKEDMLKNCKILHSKLSAHFLKNKISP